MKKLIYNIIDAVTLYKGFKVHISGFNLRIVPRYFRYFRPSYELNNINFINNNVTKSMTVIDVGAHMGLLSIILFKKVGPGGKVFSFEPTPSTFQILKRNLKLNKAIGTVVSLQKAVSEKSGSTFFYVTDIKADNSNSLSDNKRKDVQCKKNRRRIDFN